MRLITQLATLLCICLASAWAQPTIGGIVNAASYAVAPQDSNNNPIGNNNVAQGSIFVIFGTNMGPASLVQASGLPLGTSLPGTDGTSVAVSSGGQTVNAYLVYTLASQVAAILPSNAPVGVASVTVTYGGQTSKPATINVVKTQFGIFTQNSQGNGPAIAQVFAGSATPTLMGLTAPGQPGNTLVIYGTGLGAISGPDNQPPGAVSVGSNVTVNVAGNVVPASYAGRSPDFPGLDQVNFVLPANVSTGCYIPAEVTASGRPSNLFYLSVAQAGAAACTHPLGLSASALQKLDSGATVNTGMFQMLRAVVLGVPAEGAGGLFVTANANSVFQLYNRILFAFGGYNYPVASGTCAVLDTIDPPAGFSVPDFSTLGGTELKAGGVLNLSGTNGNSAAIPRMIPDTGGYLNVFFSTLGKGTWSLMGSGGADVGAFTAKTDLPDDLVWTNAGNFSTPPRTQLTITWSGGNLNAQSLVTIYGASVVVNPNDPSQSRGKQFFCNASASAGQFAVPASVTSQLPGSSVASGEVYFGQLGIYSGSGSPFSAPLTSGAAFDGGFLSYGEAHTLSVKYQ